MSGKLSGCISGVILLVVGLICLGIVIEVGSMTWPIGLATLIAAVIWRLPRRFSSAPVQAARAVAGSIAIGLLISSCLLFFFNLNSPESQLEGIRTSEKVLVNVDNAWPEWTEMSTVTFVLIVLALVAVSWWLPRARLVVRFSKLTSWLHRLSLVLAGATAFTFFSNTAILEPNVPKTYLRIEALLRQAKEVENKSLEEQLAARAMARYLQQNGIGSVNTLALAILAVPAMDMPSRDKVANYAGQVLANGGDTVESAIQTQVIAAPHDTVLALLEVQTERQLRATALADQAVEGVRSILSKLTDLLTEPAKKVATELIVALVASQGSAMQVLTQSYANELIDHYSEKAEEPVVEAMESRLRQVLKSREAPLSDREAKRTARAAVQRMAAKEAESATAFAKSAQDAVADLHAAENSKDQEAIDTALARARVSVANAKEAANYAQTAAHSASLMGANVSTPEVVGAAASSATVLADSVMAMRAAEDAAKAAEAASTAAADAVAAAEAARAAAAAAAAKKATAVTIEDIIRVIPK